MLIQLRALLIHDSGIHKAILQDQLRRAGYDLSFECVTSASGLQDALTKPWDMVFCGPGLVELDGAEPLRAIRSRLDVPIVAIHNGYDPSVRTSDNVPDKAASLEAPAHFVSVVTEALRDAEMRRTRVRAEDAMRESGKRFAQAFTHAPIGMALVGIDGVTLQVNPAFCAMFGFSEAEMLGLPVWRITHPDDMPATIENLQRLIEGERDAWDMEKRFFHRDGHVIWARTATWLVRANDTSPLYVVSQLQDITERKRLEEELRLQQHELAHALRVATMGEMVAQIAHEINQPVASIANFANGLATRLESGLADVDTMRAVVGQIAKEAMRAGDVIRQLREFLHKGNTKRGTCDANELIRETIRLVEPDVKNHGVRLELELASGRLDVDVNRVQVEQVVLNLVRNAIEALAASRGELRELHVKTAKGENRTVLVSIDDSGIGLPPENEHRIFDPFFSTKEGGLGLGLSISRSIIAAHGGELEARRNDHLGTTVTFSLPLVNNRAA